MAGVGTSGVGGQFLVNGNPFLFRGINMYFDAGFVDNGVSQWGPQALLDLFPGLNFVRLNTFQYASPASMAPAINVLTGAGVICELEDHNFPTCLTGSALANSASWYQANAAFFKDNPLVVFGTQNEPDLSSGWGAVDTMTSTIYDAIRRTGNQTLILICMAGDGFGNGFDPSIYTAMQNVGWDFHIYNNAAGYSTNFQDNLDTFNFYLNNLLGQVNLPTVVGEFGLSSGALGNVDDPGGFQMVQVVRQCGLSCLEWAYTSGSGHFPILLNNDFGNPADGLTAEGQAAAAFVSQATPVGGTSGGGGGGGGGFGPPSPSGTIDKAATDPAIIDASGNSWTLVQASDPTLGLQIARNGVVDTVTKNVILLEFLNGSMLQENSSGNWYTYNGVWTQTTPPPSPSPDGTIDTRATDPAIVDVGGNLWTLVQSSDPTLGLQIALNGTVDPVTKNVVLLEFLNGAMFQENSSGNWYTWNGSWIATTDPQSSNPPPPPPPPSPSGTTITKPSDPAIIDAAGNSWTLVQSSSLTVGLQIALNGTVDPVTNNVVLLEWLNGSILQENASGNWYTYTSGSWVQTTSPQSSSLGSLTISQAAQTIIGNVVSGVVSLSYITPGSGSFVDTSGNVYSIDLSGHAIENGVPMPGGSGTAAMEFYNSTVYGQDASTGAWSIWTGSAFVAAPSPPPPPSGGGGSGAKITYQPQYRVTGTTTWLNFGSPIAATTCTITGLLPNTDYDFQVIAIGPGGESDSSVISDMTPPQVTAVGDGSGTQASRIADMMEMMGVVTYSSPSATSSPWNSFPSDYSSDTVIAAIQWFNAGSGLGMNVREYHLKGTEAWQATWCPTVAAATGAKFSMAIAGGGTAADVASMVSLAQSSATGSHWLEWIEGLNEPNTDFGGGATAPAVMDTIQEDVWSGVQAYGLTVVGPSIVFTLPTPEVSISPGYASGSDMTIIKGNSSVANAHFYPPSSPNSDDGSGRNGAMNDVLTGMSLAYGGAPCVISEWHPTLKNTQGIARATLQASYDPYYAPIFLLSSFRLGFEAAFWYALFDFGISKACGLFPTNATNPRPAAYSIKAMYQLTGDPNPAVKRSFNPGKLNFTISGLPAAKPGALYTGGQYELFQNSAGRYFLFVWNGQSAPGGTAVSVLIKFNSHAMSKVTVYKITNGDATSMTPTKSLTTVSSMSISLTADVHLLVIDY